MPAAAPVAAGIAGGRFNPILAASSSTPRPTIASMTTVSSRHQRSRVDLLDRRRHRVVLERPALPDEGHLPPADAVRTEELINYFRFAHPNAPSNAPFSVTTEVAQCPWNPRNRLALIGLQSRRIDSERTPPRNLVFLLDVSGSMDSPDKLPLVRNAMSMLADSLTDHDRVSIVVYAGASGLVLPPTPGHRKDIIKQAIAELKPGGSTNGAAGSTSPTTSRHPRSSRAASTA